jgi:hypothetical protein
MFAAPLPGGIVMVPFTVATLTAVIDALGFAAGRAADEGQPYAELAQLQAHVTAYSTPRAPRATHPRRALMSATATQKPETEQPQPTAAEVEIAMETARVEEHKSASQLATAVAKAADAAETRTPKGKRPSASAPKRPARATSKSRAAGVKSTPAVPKTVDDVLTYVRAARKRQLTLSEIKSQLRAIDVPAGLITEAVKRIQIEEDRKTTPANPVKAAAGNNGKVGGKQPASSSSSSKTPRTQREVGPDHGEGSVNDYRKHLRHGQPPCQRSLDAVAAYRKDLADRKSGKTAAKQPKSPAKSPAKTPAKNATARPAAKSAAPSKRTSAAARTSGRAAPKRAASSTKR